MPICMLTIAACPCDMQPEDFWISAPKKGIVVFALPGERGLTELAGDFKIHFHESQGDFYWFDTFHFSTLLILIEVSQLIVQLTLLHDVLLFIACSLSIMCYIIQQILLSISVIND